MQQSAIAKCSHWGGHEKSVLELIVCCFLGGGSETKEIIAETCVASTRFLEGLHQKALALAREEAEQTLRDRRKSNSLASSAGIQPPTGTLQSFFPFSTVVQYILPDKEYQTVYSERWMGRYINATLVNGTLSTAPCYTHIQNVSYKWNFIYMWVGHLALQISCLAFQEVLPYYLYEDESHLHMQLSVSPTVEDHQAVCAPSERSSPQYYLTFCLFNFQAASFLKCFYNHTQRLALCNWYSCLAAFRLLPSHSRHPKRICSLPRSGTSNCPICRAWWYGEKQVKGFSRQWWWLGCWQIWEQEEEGGQKETSIC